jgi:hypothetical protein
MFGRFQRFEICCDAPPYAIVRACKECGFQAPLDVRWCRMSQFLKGEGQRTSIFSLRFWKGLLGRRRLSEPLCTCGHSLPDLQEYGFTISSEWVPAYFLGQCRRCKTMFWDAAVPLPVWVKEGVAG